MAPASIASVIWSMAPRAPTWNRFFSGGSSPKTQADSGIDAIEKSVLRDFLGEKYTRGARVTGRKQLASLPDYRYRRVILSALGNESGFATNGAGRMNRTKPRNESCRGDGKQPLFFGIISSKSFGLL